MQKNQVDNNYTTKLNQLKSGIEKAKTDRARAEANKETLEKRKEELLTECRGMGVEPENLESAIKYLEIEINKDLERAEKLIPKEYMEK